MAGQSPAAQALTVSWTHTASRMRIPIPGTWELLLSEIPGAAVIPWATRALELGFDGPCLRELAGHDESAAWSDLETPFRGALREVGLPANPSQVLIRRSYARDVAEAVLDGRILPGDAADRMELHVLSPLSHPADLQPWCHLQDHRHPDDYREISDTERDQLIGSEARRLLEEEGKHSAS